MRTEPAPPIGEQLATAFAAMIAEAQAEHHEILMQEAECLRRIHHLQTLRAAALALPASETSQ